MNTLPLAQEGRLRSLADFYLTTIRTAIQQQFQYRAATYMYLVGMVAEPVIYLVVWSTIADQSGGTVGGLTAGEFAAYYIVWTLVRTMNIVFTPYGWEERIREGELSGQLLRPLHPIHYDLAWFAGGKVPWVLFYLPIAAILTLVFNPTFDVRPLEIAVFAIAVWGAYLIRTFYQSALGLITFWTTRVGALFPALHHARAAALRPARPAHRSCPSGCRPSPGSCPSGGRSTSRSRRWWATSRTSELLGGLAMQALWTLIGIGLFALVWRHAIRRYTAVGN